MHMHDLLSARTPLTKNCHRQSPLYFFVDLLFPPPQRLSAPAAQRTQILSAGRSRSFSSEPIAVRDYGGPKLSGSSSKAGLLVIGEDGM